MTEEVVPRYVFYRGYPRKVRELRTSEISDAPFYVLDELPGWTGENAPLVEDCTPMSEDEELIIRVREDIRSLTDEELELALEAAKAITISDDRPSEVGHARRAKREQIQENRSTALNLANFFGLLSEETDADQDPNRE